MSTTAIDPVCHMEVEIATAEYTYEYNDQTYYFCAPGCRHSFKQDPEKYLRGDGNGHEGHDHEHHDHEHHDHH